MNRTVAKSLFYFIEYLRDEKVYSYQKELENNQYLSIYDLKHLQRNKLDKLLTHVVQYNDYYKYKYKGYDVHRSFATLPVLTKEELRDNYENIVSRVKSRQLDLVETSGSTGVPLQFYRDRIVFGYTLAALYRARRWWGIDVGSREAMLWGVPVSFKKRLRTRIKDVLLNRFRERQYNINPTTLYDFYIKLIKRKPDYVFGYSSMIYEFALYLKENDLDIKHLSLKAAICTAEKIHDYQRDVIEDIFGCSVVSEYGATEAGIISHQCPEGSNHISDDCVYVEIVDEKNAPLPDGEVGRVLVTVLNSFSSPIIRYDIGDIASKSTKSCTCGVNLSILGQIEGRTSDVVLSPNGEVHHSIIFYYIIKELTEKLGGVKQFKVCQKKIDELEFHIVKGKEFSDEADSFIRTQIKNRFGDGMKLMIYHHNQLERNQSGKLKDFVTELDTSTLLSRMYSNTKEKFPNNERN